MTVFQKMTLTALTALCLISVLPESGLAGIIEHKSDGRRSIDVSYQRFYFDLNAADLIKVNGWMDGGAVSVTSRLFGSVVFRPEFRYAKGSLDYDGPLTYLGETISTSGKMSDRLAKLFDGRILFGYKVKMERSSLTPYTGVGVRFFHIDINRIVSDTAGNSDLIDFDYIDGYLPFGVKYLSNRKDWDKGWSFGAAMETNISFAYSGAYGASASVELEKRFKAVNVAIEPFIRYWRHGKLEQTAAYDTKGPPQYSDETVGNYRHKIAVITDPAANVTETGIALKLRF